MLQVRARELLAAVIDRPGVVASSESLMEAAEGKFQSGDYAGAIEIYARLLRELEGTDDVVRREFGARAQYQTGNCYRLLDRPLDAAMAFRAGCTSWRAGTEYDRKNAQAFYEMMRSLRSSSGGATPAADELFAEAQTLVADLGAPARDQVLWWRAQALEDEQEYERAIEEYRLIEPSSDCYEKAMVGIGSCLLHLDQVDEARRIFEDYLMVYVQDPAKVPATPAHRARRREATALAEFYRGYLVSMQANQSGDLAQHAQSIEYLQRFAQDHPDQTKLVPQALYYLTLSQLASIELGAARATLARMASEHAGSSFTGSASIAVYKRLAALRETTSDPEEGQRLLREMAECLSRANALAPAASFSNLRIESSHWEDLGEWAEAEATLREILDAFGSSSDRQAELQRFVLPDLGKAVLQQGRAAEAKLILDPLVHDPAGSASKSTVLDHALSITGWLAVGAAGEIEVVPGAGGSDEEFEELLGRFNGILGGIEEYGCEWFAVQFAKLYAHYVRGQRDPSALDTCREVLAVLETVVGQTDWQIVEDRCAAADTPEALQRSSGHQALRLRFLWLRAKLP